MESIAVIFAVILLTPMTLGLHEQLAIPPTLAIFLQFGIGLVSAKNVTLAELSTLAFNVV